MNNILTKQINILPDRSLMPKIGQTGYSVSQAISELVDNAIDARKEGKLLTVSILLDSDKKEVVVKDNGAGMDEETASNALKLAYSNKKNQLGEFGLGLKTAASSLGRHYEIFTTQSNSEKGYGLIFDEEQWLEKGDWTNFELLIQSNISKLEEGTIIKIFKLNFKIYPNLQGTVRKDLATRFAPFIENGEVEIKVNTKWCIPEPLDLKTEYFPPDGKEQFRFKVESGNEVYGWRGLLKRGSEKGEYGFRVFRRGRLIQQYAKIGFNAHPEARQIVGELHLDYVPVTHNKREFIEESPLFQEIKAEGGIFWEYMRPIVKDARSSVRKTQLDQGVIDKIEEQKENIIKAIKRLPQLKTYAFPDLAEKMAGTKDEHDGTAKVDIEKRAEREMVDIVHEEIDPSDRERNPKKTHIKKSYYITINGKRLKISHDFIDMKTDDVMMDKTVDDENGIQIFSNIAFPAFSVAKDHIFYATWHIAEAIADAMAEENHKSKDEAIEIRNLILKKSSEIAKEIDEVEREEKEAERLRKEYEEKMRNITEKRSNQLL